MILLLGCVLWVDRPAVPPVHLHYGSAAPALLQQNLPASLRAADGWSRTLLIQLNGPMTRSRAAALRQAGYPPLFAIPRWAYVVEPSPAALALPDFVAFVGPFHPAYRLLPELWADPAAYQGGQLMARLLPGSDSQAFLSAILALGATLSASTEAGSLIRHVFRFEGPIPLLELAALPQLAWLEPLPELRLRNDRSRWICQSLDNPSLPSYGTPLHDLGLKGQNELIAIIDGSLAVDSCYFWDSQPIGPSHRKIHYLFGNSTPNSHGTHVCGSALGKRLSGPLSGAGLAYEARLVFSNLYAIPYATPFSTLLTHSQQGAAIHSNSWGFVAANYTALCEELDAFAHQYEDQLLIFACANDQTFPLASVQSPENALNVLAVGATEAGSSQPQWKAETHGSCAMGPTPLDGRRKPEIFAPGFSTQSADSSSGCALRSMGGSSMAAPLVAAGAALLRQYFREGRYPGGNANASHAFTPSAALLRACLLLGTVNMSRDSESAPGVFFDLPIPNDVEGWGRMNLARSLALSPAGAQLRVVDIANARGLETGEEYAFDLPLSAAAPLRICLSFTVPPGFPGASQVVVNDLDLIVELAGQTYFGNFWSNGFSQANGNPDPLNNVEQVLLQLNGAETARIRVLAREVGLGPQGFALAFSFAPGPGQALGIPDQQLPCLGSTTMLAPALLTTCPPSQIEWLPHEGLDNPTTLFPHAAPLTTTTYSLFLTDPSGSCSETATTTVTVPAALLQLSQDPIIECWGQSTTLSASASSCLEGSVSWQPSIGLADPNAWSTLASPEETTIYTFTAITAQGQPVLQDQISVLVPLMDLDGDSQLTNADWLLLLSLWGLVAGDPAWPLYQEADSSHNLRLDILDLLKLGTCLP